MPKSMVRPTQDRVREALFSSLSSRIAGARVLDLFAGSGALGLEAWSRGAASVCWVEKHPRVLMQLKSNVQRLCHEPEAPAVVLKDDVLRFLRCMISEQRNEQTAALFPVDIIMADPPYDRTAKSVARYKTAREDPAFAERYGGQAARPPASEPSLSCIPCGGRASPRAVQRHRELSQENPLQSLLRLCRDPHILKQSGILVYEMAKEEEAVRAEDWTLAKDVSYGGTRLLFYCPK